MINNKSKIDRLTKTMKSFFDKRKEENFMWCNEGLPVKQRKVMISLIKQAKRIDEDSL